MSIEDLKSRAICIKEGENLHIQSPSGKNVISYLPEQMHEKAFNYNGASICFVTAKTMHILPYHGENYVKLLTDAGYVRNPNLYVPLSDGLSYPIAQKTKWMLMMEKSRQTA